MQPADQTTADKPSPYVGDGQTPPLEAAGGWVSATVERSRTIAQLAAAELRLATSTVTVIFTTAIAIAVLVMSAWGLILAGVIGYTVQAGIPLWMVVGVAAVVHIIVAGLLYARTMKLGRNLTFAETRHQFEAFKQHDRAASEVQS